MSSDICYTEVDYQRWSRRISISWRLGEMKFWDWYVKIALVSAMIGGSMELFMIKTGFYDRVTVLEAEKRAWENSPEAKARIIRQLGNWL
ncbi:hypothetical protein K7X08_010326 [Anisodus acutangulus]|uniref:Uncharacterized protein n=1 Tax=Anisodus acutangulus TaxID=402998 RepID=A0A9Q1RRM2_9SOLA|nr:hypothetical protein K7X08_010326 [Anisodus acutangulus]